jgi:hypothetical protein
MVKVFLSYQFDDDSFVQLTTYYLRKQPDIEPFCYADQRRAEKWPAQLARAVNESNVWYWFILKNLCLPTLQFLV